MAERLSRLQGRILAWLAQERRRTRGTMAASRINLVCAMGIDKGNLSRSLTRLEDQSLIMQRLVSPPGGGSETTVLKLLVYTVSHLSQHRGQVIVTRKLIDGQQ